MLASSIKMVCRTLGTTGRGMQLNLAIAAVPLCQSRNVSPSWCQPSTRELTSTAKCSSFYTAFTNARFQHFGCSRPGHFGLCTAYRLPILATLHALSHDGPPSSRCFGTQPRDDMGADSSGRSAHWRLEAAAAAIPSTGVYPDLPLPLTSPTESKAYQRELHTVNVAIGANFIIFGAKLITFSLSGSSAMLAETIHSAVDTLNQVLLRIGITRSKRAPTAQHPYGYMKDKFVWSLVSAVGIFCLGAGVTAANAFSHFMHPPEQLEHLALGFAVLALSGVVEGYSLLVATRSVFTGAHAAGLSFKEYIRRGMDPTSIAVMLEDAAAVMGLFIAGVAMSAAHLTGNHMWDACGSLAVSCLLGATAVFLIQQNRSLLLGRSMNTADMERVLEYMRSDDVVKAIHDAKSEEIGPGIYRFKAEIEFHGDRIVDRHMERLGEGERLHQQFMAALATSRPTNSLDLALRAYGRDMIAALGAEVDRLEAGIRQVMPNIRHIDLV